MKWLDSPPRPAFEVLAPPAHRLIGPSGYRRVGDCPKIGPDGTFVYEPLWESVFRIAGDPVRVALIHADDLERVHAQLVELVEAIGEVERFLVWPRRKVPDQPGIKRYDDARREANRRLLAARDAIVTGGAHG